VTISRIFSFPGTGKIYLFFPGIPGNSGNEKKQDFDKKEKSNISKFKAKIQKIQINNYLY